MITTTQSTTYNLTLTAEQFDDLYDTLQEEIYQISEGIEDTDLELDDYDLFQVWKQLNNPTPN